MKYKNTERCFFMFNKLIIDIKKIRQNIIRVKQKYKKKIISVIKADAYGHGAVKVAECTQDLVDMFATCNTAEAEELVQNGITKDILILTPINSYLSYDNIIYSVDGEKYLPRNKRVHIAVNTGMNRYGVSSKNDFEKLLRLSIESGNRIEGIYTHFCSSDDTQIGKQLLEFSKTVGEYGIPYHLSASNTLNIDCRQDYVRLGVGQYVNAKRVQCSIVAVRDVLAGEHIGYNDTIAPKNMRIAVLSIGYADGIDRRLKNNWQIYIHGKKYDLIGDICMDCCFAMVDDAVKVGDVVDFVGRKNNIKLMSDRLGTIEYEIMCRLQGKRYEKIYLQ